jgi:opacity protein-like surface antigen
MGSSAEQFDAWFKQRLEHFEEPPRKEAWENIAERLGHNRKKRAGVFILRIAAGMALTLSLGLGYYWYVKHRGISVPPTLTESQHAGRPPRADETKMTYGNENKVHLSASSVRPGTSSSGLTEDFSLHAASPADISGSMARPVDSAGGNKLPMSCPEDLFAAVNALPACIGDTHTVPGLVIRQGSLANRPLSEDDLIVLQNLAQENSGNRVKNSDKGWILGGQFAPLYSYRNLSSDYMNDQDLNTLNKTEKGIMAYAGGVALAYKPSKRLSVESGIYYSKYGQEKTGVAAVAVNRNPTNSYETFGNEESGSYIQITITNSTGNITDAGASGAIFFDTDKTIAHEGETNSNVLNIPAETNKDKVQASDNLTAFQYFEYLEIPLIVKYKLVDRKIDFNLLGGISTNFLTGNNVKIADKGKKYDFGETDDITKVNYSGSVGIGLEYPVLSNLVLNIEPKFRYYLNPIDKSVNVNVYPYSFGLFAGISYVF